MTDCCGSKVRLKDVYTRYLRAMLVFPVQGKTDGLYLIDNQCPYLLLKANTLLI